MLLNVNRIRVILEGKSACMKSARPKITQQLPIGLSGSSITGHSLTLFTTITNVNCIVAQHRHIHKNNSTFSHNFYKLTNASFATCNVLHSPFKTKPD